MEKPMIRIVESDGNIVDREMTDEEFAQWQIDEEEILAKKQAKIASENQRQALLDKLGITEEEAKLLLS
jgi:hypothetical protein